MGTSGLEWPALVHQRLGLITPILHRLSRRHGRDVMIEDVDIVSLDPVPLGVVLVAGVLPVLEGPLSGDRDHARHQDKQVDRHARADEGCGEAPERMRHHDDVAAVAGRLHHHVGVGRPPGRRVLDRQVDGNPVVAAAPQLPCHHVPVETASPPPWIST